MAFGIGSAIAATSMANTVSRMSAANSNRQTQRQNEQRLNQGRRRVIGSYINGDGKDMTLLEIERNAVLDLWAEHLLEMQTWMRSNGWELSRYKNRYLYIQMYSKDSGENREGQPKRGDFPNDYEAWEEAYITWYRKEFTKFVSDVLPTYEHYDTLIAPYVDKYSLEQ